MKSVQIGCLGVLVGVALLWGTPNLWAQAGGTCEMRIEKALKDPSTADFIEEPLVNVVDYFEDFHQIAVQIDKAALEEMGLDDRVAITISADGISLESMLGLVLEPRGLTWTVRHETLLLTTNEAARKAVSTRIYLIDKLLREGHPGPYEGYDDYGYGEMMPGVSQDPLALLKVIKATIEPNSWAKTGPGSAEFLLVGNRPVLVIRQDYRTHRLIRQLLDDLGRLDEDPPPASKASAKPSSRARPPARAIPTDDPFGAPAPAQPAADPFGAPAGPGPARPADDPFGGGAPADDPFGAPAPAGLAPPRPADDPFATPSAPARSSPARGADPFGSGAPARDPSRDPFGSPAADDPFGG